MFINKSITASTAGKFYLRDCFKDVTFFHLFILLPYWGPTILSERYALRSRLIHACMPTSERQQQRYYSKAQEEESPLQY